MPAKHIRAGKLAAAACVAVATMLAGPAIASADLQPCEEAPEGQCGTVEVPLDPADPAAGTVSIFFHYYPHSDTKRPPRPPIFATAGGPGASITQFARDAYRFFLLEPLRERHDLVLIDQRGVGRSGAIDCDLLQHGPEDAYAAFGSCGDQLGSAASLYGSANVARDIEAVRAALGVPRFVFYGASYSGVDVQAYATRYPKRLRAVVLDSPASTVTFDPWFRADITAIRRGVDFLCTRSASCSAAIQDGVDELSWLARRLRKRPVDGVGYDATGAAHTLHVTESFLATHIAGSDAGGFVAPSEIPAAAQALRHDDPAPLLRLAADTEGSPFGDEGDPAGFSMGHNAARICTDNVFQWDKNASPSTRRAQWATARDALDPREFAPFSIEAWAVADYFNPDPCVQWPAPGGRVEPPVPPGTNLPAIPALVLAGDLDSITPLEKSRDVADLFPRSRFVTIANSGHHTAFNWRSDCAAPIVQRFLATFDPGDTTCATRPDFRSPPSAASRWSRTTRNRASRKEAAIAPCRATGRSPPRPQRPVTDAFRRTMLSFASEGVGLRGGSYQAGIDDNGITLDLSAARFATDVSVTGRRHPAMGVGSDRRDHPSQRPGRNDGTLRVSGAWLTPGLPLTLRGTLGGRRVALLAPAT